MKEIKLSPSTISLMLECKRCFWLHVKEGIKRPNGIFPSLPSGVDKVLKTYFDKHREKNKLPKELKELKGYELFLDKDKLEIWRNVFKGIEFKDESGVILRGAVDDLLVKDGRLSILDFKTRGFEIKENTPSFYQTQLDLYAFLLKMNGYEVEDYSFLLFYYPESVDEEGRFIFENKLVRLSSNPSEGKKVLDMAINVLQNGIPTASKDCEYCKYCEVRKWIK